MKKLCTALLVLLFLVSVAFPAAAQEGHRKIRVGFPLQAGMSEMDHDGNFSGYTYEYLQEIAQYTGWEYEFVPIPESHAPMPVLMDLLEQGHIDLLGPLVPSELDAVRFSFPGYSYGMSYSALYVSDDNTTLNETNYRDVDGMRIAVQRHSLTQIADLQNFFSSNDINAQLVYYDSEEEMTAAVRSGQADALLGKDVALFNGMRIIAKFAPTPFYFATTKGNTSIVSSLNLAIQKINASDPYFSARLFEKYFTQKSPDVFLSERERAYIRQRGMIRVVVVPDRAPFQYYDESGEFCGVTRNVFDSISDMTGLQFSFSPASNGLENSMDDCDLVAAVPYDYQLAEQFDYSMTRPFAESQIVMISNRSADISSLDDKRLVLPRGFILEGHTGADILRLPSVRDCIEAVEHGRADFSFANGYTASYYNNQAIYKNITLTPQTGLDQRICIGVAKPVDVDLLTILNKCILSMGNDGAIQTMLYTHTAPATDWFSLSFLLSNYPTECLLSLAVIAALALAIVGWVLRIRAAADKKLSLAGERYMLLAEIANEYLFEYDYAADKIFLSPKLASLFGCGQSMEHWKQFVESSGDTLAYDPAGILKRKTKKEKFERDLLLPLPGEARCWFRVLGVTLYSKDEKPTYLMGKLTNIQKEMEEKGLLLEKSQKDGLTGVYNAATSREVISSYLAKRPSCEAAALLIVDVDSFKSVNDLMGHLTGDEVLKDIASQLRSQVRKSDIVGRLGGDEFIVLIKDATGKDAVLRKGDELCAAVRKIIRSHGHELLITISVGGVMAEPGAEFNELYKKADQALYTVKRLGKDRFYLWNGSMEASLQPRGEEIHS